MRKSTMQRTMASAMTAALLVTVLTGCGKSGNVGNTSFEKNGKGSTLEVSLDHSYSSEQIKFDNIPHIGGFMPMNDKLLIVGYDETYENEIYCLYNPEDSSTTEVDLKYPETLPEDGYSYMAGGFVNNQGGMTILHRAYVDGEDENGDYQYEDLGLTIVNYDNALKMIDSKKIESSTDFNFGNITAKPDGGYYATSWDENGNSTFSILDDEFEQVGKVDGSFQYISNIFTTKDNVIYVVYQDQEWNEQFAKLNTESNQLENIEVEGMPQWFNNYFPSVTDDYTLYATDSTSVYGINLDKGICEEVVNWVNSDFMGDYVGNISQLPDGRFILVANDVNYENSEVWVLSPRDPEELKNIKLISLATLYLPSNLSVAINQFNRYNDEYRIAVVDYEQYNTDDNYEAGLEKLKDDMTAGIVADLICTSNIPYESFCNKGIFTDLTDKVNSLSSDEYFTNVFDALKYGDKLYQMGFAFQVNTIEAKTEHVGESCGISLVDFTKFVTELPDGMTAFEEMTKDSALYALVTNNLAAFTDVKNGTCNFNTSEFVQLLELCNTYTDEAKDYGSMTDSDWEKYWAEQYYQYINDKVLFRRAYISSLKDSYRERFTYFGDAPVTMIGYPTTNENSNGGRLSTDFTLAISAGSAYKEQCWNFFESMLSDDYQESLSWMIPVKKSVFDKQAEEAMKPDTYNENARTVAMTSTIWRGDEEVEMPDMPQSYVDELKTYISGVTESGYYDEKIYEIVQEEADMFFSGDQTAQQAADMIQSRASLYLSEQS